jgi:ribosomal protein S13
MSQVIKGMNNNQMSNKIREITNKTNKRFNMDISDLSEEQMDKLVEAVAQSNSNKYNNLLRTETVKDRLRSKLEKKNVNQ